MQKDLEKKPQIGDANFGNRWVGQCFIMDRVFNRKVEENLNFRVRTYEEK